MELENRAAIVTGGAQGIGKAVCLRLAREGAHVLVADNQPQKARQVSEEIASMGNRSSSMEVDVSVKQNVEEMVAKALEIFRKIDILVNAAGIFIASPIEDVKEADWDRVIAVNLKGTFLCAQTVGKAMIKQKHGNIVNIASIAGKTPQINLAAYSPSKAGVILLTEIMAVEWAKYDIRVNAVCPGPTATPMFMNIYDSEEKLKRRQKAIPLNRIASPDEIAGAVVYLCSSGARFITGEALVIDGGSAKSMFYLMGQLPERDE